MIVAVRHPRPAIDASVCYGRLDVALAVPVAEAALELAGRLGPEPFARVVTSPLQRARDLAEAIADSLGLAVAVEPRLSEMSFGRWEGVAWAAIGREEIDAWARDPLGYRPGGGETVSELAERVGQVLGEAAAGRERQLWITHAGPMRCLYAATRGMTLERCLDRRFDYGEMLELNLPTLE